MLPIAPIPMMGIIRQGVMINRERQKIWLEMGAKGKSQKLEKRKRHIRNRIRIAFANPPNLWGVRFILAWSLVSSYIHH